MADPLPKLFGSSARVKLLRLFLFNPRHSFTLPEAAQRSRTTSREARREVALFVETKLAKRTSRGKGIRYTLNDEFKYLSAMQQLLLNAPERADEIRERLRRTGAIKLIVLSGIFAGEWDSALDILVVGDRVKERILRERVRRLESEIGRELRYTLLASENFLYRLNMNDKLTRDVFDYPHIIILDKFNIGLK